MIVGYARVSTVGQSLESQLEQLGNAGCEKIFQEKRSGKNSDREQFQIMMDFVREGDTIIVTKLDRLARSMRDFTVHADALRGKGVTFKILNIGLDTSSPTAKLMLNMLAAFAEFEREIMLERQADGIAKAKDAGKYKGRKPSAKNKAKEILALASEGKTRQAIADQLDIGVASVYRVLAANKSTEPVQDTRV